MKYVVVPKWPKTVGTSGTNPLGGLILPIYTLTKQKKQKKKNQFCTTSYNTVQGRRGGQWTSGQFNAMLRNIKFLTSPFSLCVRI